MRIPRIVLAAPASGAGKTSIATGLLAALRARGLAVSPHKVGPDYIDPGYHALAAGRTGRNLDPWLVGERRIMPLFLHGALTPRRADVAVIEGVMGLFDGHATRAGFGSTAHVATLLAAPVVLVVDARSAGRSVAATVHGFRSFDQAVRIGGVVFNQVGTERHAEILRAAMAEIGMPVLGILGRRDSLVTPSRHLGLVPAAERAAPARAAVAELADAVGAGLDLDALLALAATAPDLPAEPWDPRADAAEVPEPAVPAPPAAGPPGPCGRSPVVAVAGGPAFTFGYAETPELLAAAGAEVARFDPTVDEALPDGTSALVIGGGFPQVHAGALAANAALRARVRAFAATGAPVAAECAGLLYLSRALDGEPMCGVLGDVTAAMTPRLTLGYREAVAVTDSVLAARGTLARGHEFHRTVAIPPAGGAAGGPPRGTAPAWTWRDAAGDEVTEGFVRGGIHASYLHTHWAGLPGTAARFVAAAHAAQANGAVRAAG
ncbi:MULTISPECIES: cobyrinate a,c-diamide synthase [unclassified Pseudofrankia]|uniref:cobyrinate a,c-diamide synthase n=1 Tax=unclassified Pseudofrankia TaxID=2994372 RepID=UPI0008DA0193|nr:MULTISPECIES: cobyrinate a,c-diamide synthase [unclassified Pseudofrankia]MDT3446246.1 cobyrinate a,c-diamide synthase [Pseudofrankia sp. BMG5.37]OHV49867.1 cobyrinic acid a,c-diamide synthase [Pseudofrankia sp. BMG5.36]